MTRFQRFDAHEPKQCRSCGRTHSDAQWAKLPLVGHQVIGPYPDDPGEVLELKNCQCGSTLAIQEPFTAAELERGAQHELEHTGDLRVARQIAIDHLHEEPRYYEKLEKAGL
jgi:Protein of unknown function (DUF5661)